jgi:5-(carboxyamino)imidazole ribonucleotide synthase
MIDDLKIGVLGGGQLGRMMIQSALDFNLDIHVLDPDPEAPCKDIAAEFTVGKLTNFQTVLDWAAGLDLITIEIENVNVDALKELEKQGKKVYPQPQIIEMIQDKGLQKQFYLEKDIPTAPFELTGNREELNGLSSFLPAVHKLRREGYDGRGVQKIMSIGDISKGFDAPAVLEKFVPFDKELSVIVARNHRGEVSTFPVVELVFHPEQNLVEYLFAPADIEEEIVQEAENVAVKVAAELEIIGLLAVEMFLTKEGEILVNEIAPRTHNSGHHTIESNTTSQFEQHLRAILNLPLGSTYQRIPAAMVNLLGEDGYQGLAKYSGLETVLALEGVHVHLYGKKFTKPFRKMGHVTLTGTDMQEIRKTARIVKESLKIIA